VFAKGVDKFTIGVVKSRRFGTPLDQHSQQFIARTDGLKEQRAATRLNEPSGERQIGAGDIVDEKASCQSPCLLSQGVSERNFVGRDGFAPFNAQRLKRWLGKGIGFQKDESVGSRVVSKQRQHRPRQLSIQRRDDEKGIAVVVPNDGAA
jgi:hypothetical protein